MFDSASMKFLEDLLNSASPSGYEAEAAKVFKDYVKGFSDTVYQDVLGNTVGTLNPNADFRVMLSGHYDEIGFQIVHISDEGLLYFRCNGGIDKLNVPSSEVDILTSKGRVRGVIGKKPIHLLKPSERDQAVEITDMWIDIGAENKEEAESMVSIGDPVAMRSTFRMLGANRVMSKGMDDKIGAFVVAETLRRLSERKLNVGVFGAGSVQEELGLRGSYSCAYKIEPQAAFVIDVGFTTDLPDIPKKMLGDVKLGGGPEIARTADNNEVLVNMVRKVADANKFIYQNTAGHRATGGTEAASIQLSRRGVATCLLSIPNRYMHSAVEICDLRDVESAVNILVETIASLKGDESFIPCI